MLLLFDLPNVGERETTVSWRATPDDDEHYCFAVALWNCSLRRV